MNDETVAVIALLIGIAIGVISATFYYHPIHKLQLELQESRCEASHSPGGN